MENDNFGNLVVSGYVIFHGYFHDNLILISKIEGTWFSKGLMNL